MTILHMETEEINGLVYQLTKQAYEMNAYASRLRKEAGKLSVSWQSPQADIFHDNLLDWLYKFDKANQTFQLLVDRLQREVNEWIQVDNNQTRPDYYESSNENVYQQLFLTGGNLLGVAFGLMEFGQKFSYKDYQSFGRLLNRVFHTRGYIKAFDELGHMLKQNPKLTNILGMSFSYGFGVASDLISGDEFDDAVGSELIELAMKVGIGKVLYGVPVVGQVFILYDVALGLGGILGGGLSLMGLEEEAAVVNDFVEKADVADWVSDRIYDYVEYGVTEALPDMLNVVNSIDTFGCGMVNNSSEIIGVTL